MQIISEDIVEKTWQKISGMSPSDAPLLVKKMEKQQPVLLSYLLGVNNDMLNQDERELLIYIGIVVWQIMLKGDKSLKKVSEKTLDERERNNLKMLEYLEGETDLVKTTKKIIENYNQSEVLKYIIEALMEEELDKEAISTEIRDENIGAMFISLKTMIDCLDQ